MLELLRYLLSTLIPRYKHYFSSKDALKEVYNQDNMLNPLPLNEKDHIKVTGIDILQRFPDRLENLVKEMLKKYAWLNLVIVI